MIEYNELLNLNAVVCKNSNQKSIVINEANLKSALGIQQWYEDDRDRACALFRSLIIAHGFQDGNKRTAVLALVSQLEPKIPQEDVAVVAIMIATGELKEVEDIKLALYGD
jgi:prophage maintenance system killer protein